MYSIDSHYGRHVCLDHRISGGHSGRNNPRSPQALLLSLWLSLSLSLSVSGRINIKNAWHPALYRKCGRRTCEQNQLEAAGIMCGAGTRAEIRETENVYCSGVKIYLQRYIERRRAELWKRSEKSAVCVVKKNLWEWTRIHI